MLIQKAVGLSDSSRWCIGTVLHWNPERNCRGVQQRKKLLREFFLFSVSTAETVFIFPIYCRLIPAQDGRMYIAHVRFSHANTKGVDHLWLDHREQSMNVVPGQGVCIAVRKSQ